MPMNASPLHKVAPLHQSQTATTLPLTLSDNFLTLLVETFPFCFARLWWGHGRVAPGQRKELLMGPSRTRI